MKGTTGTLVENVINKINKSSSIKLSFGYSITILMNRGRNIQSTIKHSFNKRLRTESRRGLKRYIKSSVKKGDTHDTVTLKCKIN